LCWWYGEDHASENDVEFDALFRALRAIYELIELPVPRCWGGAHHLARVEVRQSEPSAALRPVLDGEIEERRVGAAGVYRVPFAGASMHRGERPARDHFGVGGDMLWVLIEPTGEAASS